MRRTTKTEQQFAKRIDTLCQIVANKKDDNSPFLLEDLECLLREYQCYRNKLRQEHYKSARDLVRIVEIYAPEPFRLNLNLDDLCLS